MNNTWVLSWKELAFFRSLSKYVLNTSREKASHRSNFSTSIQYPKQRNESLLFQPVLLTLDEKEELWIRMIFSGDVALGDTLFLQKGCRSPTEEKLTSRSRHMGWNPMAQTCGHAFLDRLKFLQDPQGSVAGMTNYKKDQLRVLLGHWKTMKHCRHEKQIGFLGCFSHFLPAKKSNQTRSQQDLSFLKLFLIAPYPIGLMVV